MTIQRRLLLNAACGAAAAALLASSGCFAGGHDDQSAPLTIAMATVPSGALTPVSEDAFKLVRWSTAETLLGLDEHGALQARLATEWAQLDDRTWRLVLRDDVLFHDGTPLDAEAAARSLNAVAQAAAVPRVIDGLGLTAEADGDLTLTVATAEPDPVLPQRLTSPMLVILAESAYADGLIDPVGTGTGPFMITESTSTGASMERFDDYWGEPAALDRFRADYVPDAGTRVAALRSGEADVIEAVPYAQLDALDDERLQDAPTSRTVSFYLNSASGPLSDEGLRAAVAAAVDPGPIVDGIYEGRADAPEGLFGPALPWAGDHRDVTLQEAVEPAGEALTIATYSNRAELPEALTVIASQLESAGFAVETVVREYNDIEKDMLAGEFDGFLMSRSTVQDSGDSYAYLSTDFTSGGAFNVSQLADAEVDAAVAAIADLPAGAERFAAVLDAEAAILGVAAVVPIAHERLVTGVSERVANVGSDPRELRIITAETTLR